MDDSWPTLPPRHHHHQQPTAPQRQSGHKANHTQATETDQGRERTQVSHQQKPAFFSISPLLLQLLAGKSGTYDDAVDCHLICCHATGGGKTVKIGDEPQTDSQKAGKGVKQRCPDRSSHKASR
ncbi:hypothetical protein E2C01_019406 [Portunus trituberculatus]|uniref:Uncharacterized protein n=1 Tax=Portunus trituberculatus TaxID=210409 RepID=A0A5B7DXH9_PORTR|nr:hypothetical protein [Portunus trituberculatus]